MTALAVVGTGLVGTSVALAARAAGYTVRLHDRDPDALSLAVALGAGDPGQPDDLPADLAVLAVPPAAIAPVLRAAQDRGLAAAYTDVASTKSGVVAQARWAGCDLTTFQPGHPMAGGETTGPGRARADLFRGARWVLCTDTPVSSLVRERVVELVAACGAVRVEMTVEEHDAAVARVSHAPHVVASALAATLLSAAPSAVGVAGRGVRDTIRIAGGDPGLWTDILVMNAAHVAGAVAEIAAELSGAAEVLAALASGDRSGAAALAGLLDRGRAGRAYIAG